MQSISIIIPLYNEGKIIAQTVKTVINYAKKLPDYEVICVNDGSTDDTVKQLDALKKKYGKLITATYPENHGKGYAVKQGALVSTKEYCLICDADLSTPITELDTFIQHASTNNIIIGKRTKHSIIKSQSFIRQILGKTFSLLKQIILDLDFEDAQCGFKLFDHTAKKLFSLQKINGFAFDTELLYLAKQNNLKIKEIPVPWTNRTQSSVKLWCHPLNMLIELIKIKFNKYTPLK